MPIEIAQLPYLVSGAGSVYDGFNKPSQVGATTVHPAGFTTHDTSTSTLSHSGLRRNVQDTTLPALYTMLPMVSSQSCYEFGPPNRVHGAAKRPRSPEGVRADLGCRPTKVPRRVPGMPWPWPLDAFEDGTSFGEPGVYAIPNISSYSRSLQVQTPKKWTSLYEHPPRICPGASSIGKVKPLNRTADSVLAIPPIIRTRSERRQTAQLTPKWQAPSIPTGTVTRASASTPGSFHTPLSHPRFHYQVDSSLSSRSTGWTGKRQRHPTSDSTSETASPPKRLRTSNASDAAADFQLLDALRSAVQSTLDAARDLESVLTAQPLNPTTPSPISVPWDPQQSRNHPITHKPFVFWICQSTLVSEIMSHVEFTEQFSNFLLRCRPLRQVLAVPYLQQRDILRLTEDSVHISFRGKCPLAAALLSCLPVYDTAVFVTVGLEAIVKCQKQLKRFFKRQKVWHLSVEFPVHSPHSIGLEAAAPSLFVVLHSLKAGLFSLCLDTVQPFHDPPMQPLPIVPPSTTEGQFAGVWNLYRTVRSVRSITLSAEWTHLPHFHRLWAAVADAKQLATLTVSNITSQDQCNQLLSPLRSHSLKDLYILTKMNTALNLSSDFLQRHRGLKRMSLMAVPDPFDSTASSVPMTLPATPEIRLTSNFPSLTAVDASTISRLTMVPPCRYRLPSSMAYCNSLELFLRGVWSLDAISFHELDLSLEFPWRITEHLTSTVAGCQCLQLIQGFTITGVKKLRIVSDDFSSSAMAYFAQFQDIFVDMEELHYNVTSAVFRQSGGCSVSLATPPRAPNLRTFSVLDGTWTYDGIWTYDRQLWAPKEPTSRA